MGHLCYFCIVLAMLSRMLIGAHWCLVVTCWERAYLLVLVCGVELCGCYIPIWYPVSGVVLDCIDS